MSDYRCCACGAKLLRNACWVRASDGAQFCFAHRSRPKPQLDMIAKLDAWAASPFARIVADSAPGAADPLPGVIRSHDGSMRIDLAGNQITVSASRRGI